MDIKETIEILDKYEYSTKLELNDGTRNHVCDSITVEDFFKMKEIAIKALEKQIPKKIFNYPWSGINGVPYDLCPNCETNLCTAGRFSSKKENYCGFCGQKLEKRTAI